ncbi:uncharacterized protein K489DRAFT_188313 [Dissoconium aciculare CBS 342.82]|uniref:Uncharacterized protein n=1 Tax=Dissoconium aciculare CBS 342.82 TaxID=1314786 RepID=A0A6J3MCZ9_9PEZI|nr:uncharacterized protein K489DRAFT_188313 [Dissoconium aciculare CBS 342.82]KAF1824717.1 hypothetical protein K489DRAFT_188313 [Dissoconium aciculare CBS 342.82]
MERNSAPIATAATPTETTTITSPIHHTPTTFSLSHSLTPQPHDLSYFRFLLLRLLLLVTRGDSNKRHQSPAWPRHTDITPECSMGSEMTETSTLRPRARPARKERHTFYAHELQLRSSPLRSDQIYLGIQHSRLRVTSLRTYYTSGLAGMCGFLHREQHPAVSSPREPHREPHRRTGYLPEAPMVSF